MLYNYMAYYNVDVLLHKTRTHTLGYQTHKIPRLSKTNLDTDFKIMAISETWIKPHHISYNIPNYNLEQNFRLKKKRWWGSIILTQCIAFSTTK